MLVPAYAATIHKSQGSEYPAVIIPVLTQHYAMLQRNLLYTGVTRGKRLVVMVGQKKAVAIAVRNASGRRRWSKLAGMAAPWFTRLSAYMGVTAKVMAGSGFPLGFAGASMARRARAGLDATDIRKFAGTAARTGGHSDRDPNCQRPKLRRDRRLTDSTQYPDPSSGSDCPWRPAVDRNRQPDQGGGGQNVHAHGHGRIMIKPTRSGSTR